MGDVNSYEEVRKKRVQHNLKQLEKFGVAAIANDLAVATKKERKQRLPSNSKEMKRKGEDCDIRRSSRARNTVVTFTDEFHPTSKQMVYRNKPKRPPSAFFVFMEGFRKEFKKKHPENKSMAAVGKASGEKWKLLSDSEKVPYVSKAEKLKAEYDKKIAAYNKGEKNEEEVEESDKSKSEISDDNEEGSGNAEEDPNKPKRPPGAFFVFMEEFRKEFKEKHPENKSVAAVGKASGEKWRSLSDSEKVPYVSKAEKLKAEYYKKIAAYNKGEKPEEEVEESDKSKSEISDDNEEGSGRRG